VIDNKTPVADVVAAAGKDAGSPITLKASSASSSARASRRRKRLRRRSRRGRRASSKAEPVA
jgi:hypothetical protein